MEFAEFYAEVDINKSNSEEEEILDENEKDQSFTDDREIEEGLS